ncbi:MAG: hypothetical protein LIO93_04285, partial [Bacteroidales bacterium]|nr:hypothetical protein [Bacteroidales bacterium]
REMLRYLFIASFLLLNTLLFTACKDDYPYNDEEPPRSILAPSIYDYLTEEGNYKLFTQIADSVAIQGGYYSDVLKKTGSKTAFVANDEAFAAFFASNNTWGVNRFEDLTEAQRRMILFSSLIDDAYSLDMLSSMPGQGNSPAIPGEVMRKTSSMGLFDTIPFEKGDNLPKTNYWSNYHREKGIYLMKDNSIPTLAYFIQSFMDSKAITDDDFYRLTGKTRSQGDAFIFDIKITQPDLFCKNGYVNVLEEVLIPRDNMAEYIRKNPETQLFNSFLERFCAPYPDMTNTYAYIDLNPNFRGDTLYYKRFFIERSDPSLPEMTDPEGRPVLKLPFDPGQNNYSSPGQSMEANMAAMFVPTDAALEEYFERGDGRILKERYGTWENVPDNVLLDLIAHQMKPSFLLTLPSKFGNLEDKMGTNMGVDKDDVTHAEICSNGAVYVVDKVYAPTEYVAVSAPVSLSDETKIFQWAIDELEFNLYLLSMEEGNLFSFFVPVDNVFKGTFDASGKMTDGYVDPVVLTNSNKKEFWSFSYNETTANVQATVYDGDEESPTYGDSLRLITTTTQIQNRLLDLLDNHIIVGELEKGKYFYQTKGRATLKANVINLDADPNNTRLEVQGGANIENGNQMGNAIDTYFQANGNTYFTDQVLQPALKSVYQILQDTEEFEEFYNLCAAAKTYLAESSSGIVEYAGPVFIQENNATVVSFFNTYHYTVYIPTNAAIRKAISDGVIKTWEEIDAIIDPTQQGQEAQKLYEFIRYHFQDNSVYVTNKVSSYFETATLNPADRKFRKIRVVENNGELGLFAEKNPQFSVTNPNFAARSASVVKAGNLYNIMARDYRLEGTGSSMTIATSSFAVMHLIDNVLDYNKVN